MKTDKIYTIDEIKAIVAPIAKKYGVEKMWLFGSYARGEATSESDLDFRVARGRIRSYIEAGGLYNELEANLGKSLDLITSRRLDADFARSVERDEVIVYEE